MLNFWSQKKKYPGFRQALAACSFVVTSLCWGQVIQDTLVARRPASYVPDDDVIIKPVDNELSFYQQYVASDNSEAVVTTRNQIKIWNDNQQFADQYGLDTRLAGSPYFVPTPEEKFEFFKDRYMRYLRRKGEQPFKDMPKEWYQEFRASREVDTIDEMEARFRSTTKKTVSNKELPVALQQKEVSIWKQTRFIFQPRIEQGLVIVGIRGPIAYARAWVGLNGETEVNVQKSIDSIGFRMMFNYYAHTGEYFTSVDQRIVDNLYARFTSQKTPDQNVPNDMFMLLYAKQF